MNFEKRSIMEDEYIRRHHKHEVKENQCSSSLVKHIKAPVHLVKIRFGYLQDSFLFLSKPTFLFSFGSKFLVVFGR